MKKLFKKVETTKSMETTMEEVTSQIIEEHYATVEEMDKVNKEAEEILSKTFEAEANEILNEIQDLLNAGKIRQAYHKGLRTGMITGGACAIGGMMIGTALLMKLKI